MDTAQIFELLSIPQSAEILKSIWRSRQGIRFDELKSQLELHPRDLYDVILQLTECGLVFYASDKYELNPIGRGVMEAINIIERAVQGEDIVVFDISQPSTRKVTMYIDNIVQN